MSLAGGDCNDLAGHVIGRRVDIGRSLWFGHATSTNDPPRGGQSVRMPDRSAIGADLCRTRAGSATRGRVGRLVRRTTIGSLHSALDLVGDRMDLAEVVEQFRSAADQFAKGNPGAVKAVFSHREDVTLANPFGPAVRGWDQVSKALDYASSRFRDGAVGPYQRVAEYVTDELACIFEVERWEAKVGGRDDTAIFDLRVTSTFRREDGTWKLVHRHADPIATEHADGPLRSST